MQISSVPKKNFFILLLTIVSILQLSGQEDIYFSKIGIEEGLSQLTVMTIFEDELGNIWFGTREGVNIYNGTTMRSIQPNDTYENVLSGNVIRNIIGDFNGSVFIHTQNGVDIYDQKMEKIINLIDMQVNGITYGSDYLWYAKYNRIFRVEEGSGVFFAELGKNAMATVMRVLKDGRIIVGTVSSGLFEIDTHGVAKQLLRDCSQVSSIFEDKDKNIWVGTWDKGLYKLDKSGVVTNYRKSIKDTSKGLSSSFVRAISEDDYGNIWIGTKLGLDKLNVEEHSFCHYGSDTDDQSSLSHESIWALLKDRSGNIWAGTYFGGVNYFSPEASLYTIHDLKKGEYANSTFPVISQIVEYDDSTFLLCTEGSGLIRYNMKNKKYRKYAELENYNIKSACLDKQSDRLYLGLHLGGLVILDLKTEQIKHFPDIRPELSQSDVVRKILAYEDQFLIATHNGLYLFDELSEQFAVFSEELHQHVTFFVDINLDENDNLWVGGRGLYKYHIPTKQTTPYFYHADSKGALSNNSITKVYVDKGGSVWLATAGGGVNLYDEESDSFTVYNSITSGLSNNYVSNLIGTETGNIYITTTGGLSILDIEQDKIINLDHHNSFPLNSLFNGGITVSTSGDIIVAGLNGMVSFSDQQQVDELQPVELRFANLWINNQPVLPGDKTGVLSIALPYTEKLKFNHKQSIVGLSFATDNLNLQDKYQYLYRINGLSNHWITLREGVKEINLINLHPGRYTLELRAVSPYSNAILGNTSIGLRIKPPFYKSAYAYLLFFMFVIFLLLLYLRYLKDKNNLKNSLEYEIKEKEHIEEVNQMKLQFFTNISHEFRTPLTLISSQTEMMLREKNLATDIQDQVMSISRNTKMMQRLINELLDFRKAVNDRLSLKVAEYDMVAFLKEITQSFGKLAQYKEIELTFSTSDDAILLWFDPIQMQKIFYNLISNAFKYTPNEGRIDVRITQSKNNVLVVIEDTGYGISKEDLDKIFDRFYQVTGNSIDKEMSGTGLGLTLSKLIANAHGADINVESELGKGSSFEIVLLKGNHHFDSAEITTHKKNDVIAIEHVEEFLPKLYEESIKEIKEKKEHTILIVEDNIELLNVLEKLFENSFNVIKAVNGEEGLAKTIEHQPDIVLSDLMMPVMSGNEMCLRIKSNFAVSHIPVVLLTAQTAIEYNIESLKFGADDYISKPFDAAVLLARCTNLVNGRKQLQEKFAQSTEFNSQSVASNEMDKEFLDKANQVIEDNIDNPDFDMNEFSRQMNLSRTGLFNKMKGVTGQTPNEFILNIKMKKATYLLKEQLSLNITDISYKLGFNSPKYFSQCFRNQFGMSPSKFRSSR